MSKKNHEHEQEEIKSEKKDPELFENEPLDMQPSRKGRIVSTMIVIVVAILVIWVFARNNEEPQNETAKEDVKQEETASAEPIKEAGETANEATDPVDQLAALKSEFNNAWQATTDEINSATEMALTNFDDKKAAAVERLSAVDDNFKKTADKTIDQGLASAKKKVDSLSQTTLKSLTNLQSKTLAKTTVEQLETALTPANEQLASAKDQVMTVINDNTEKLTATIDQAVTKATEQSEEAKQKLAQQSVTEAEKEVTVIEDTTTKTEVVAETPAQEENNVEPVKPATVTSDGIEVTAESGDSITKLARKALTSAMNSGQVSNDLSAEQRIYIEDYLQNRTGNHRVAVGESQTFSKDLVNEAVDHAKNLSESQIEHLKIYSSQVSF